MRASSVKFDIRTRVAVSFLVSIAATYMKGSAALVFLGVMTFLYVHLSRRWKVLAVTYLLIVLMSVLSVGVITASYHIALHFATGTHYEKTVASLGPMLLGNFHTPFLRMIPTTNVMLALAFAFDVQAFSAAMLSLRLPRVVYLPALVFFRFIPEFTDNLGKLRDAVRMRGISVGFGSLFLHPLTLTRLTFVPFTIRTLRLADHLAIAAEMKGVGTCRKPTQLNPPRFSRSDAVLFVSMMAAVAVAALVEVHARVR